MPVTRYYYAIAMLLSCSTMAQPTSDGLNTQSAESKLDTLRASTPFKESGGSVQRALESTHQLVSSYGGMDRTQILSLSKERDGAEEPEGRIFKTQVDLEDSTVMELEYDTRLNRLSSLHVRRDGGAFIEIAFVKSNDPSVPERLEAEVHFPENNEHVMLLANREVTALYMAISIVGPRFNGTFDGKGSAWDPKGGLVGEVAVKKVRNPYDVRKELLGVVPPGYFDLIGISMSDRVEISRSYRRAEFELKRTLENLSSWSEKIVTSSLSDPVTVLGGDEAVIEEKGDVTIQAVTVRGRPHWTIERKAGTGVPVHARYDAGGLELYYVHDSEVLLAGGTAVTKSPGKYSLRHLIDYYPERKAPRMAIILEGSSEASICAKANQTVWGPDGEVLLTIETDKGVALTDLLERFESSLSATVKEVVGWRGASQELHWLPR